MRLKRLGLLACAVALLATSFVTPSQVQADPAPIKIAVITDMSGVYSGVSGPGAVLAAKMAVEDFGGSVLGRPIVVDAVDHRNKPAIAAEKAREEFTSGAELALDMPNSGTALAVMAVGKELHKLSIMTGSASTAITGSACDKYTYMYAYNTYALGHTTGAAIAKAGGHSWYAIVPDYAFGKAMLADYTAGIKPYGGFIQHADTVPLGTTDFSSYMISAKDSGAQVLALFNAGADAINAMKSARQFGLDKTMKIAVGLLFLRDVDAAPDAFTGSRITTSWYWDQDAPSRAFAARFAARLNGFDPDDVQAADYSAVTQWLNAVKAVGSVDADKVVAYLDGRKFSDFYAHNATWRARDHQVTHDMYFVQVLAPSEIKAPHAWFKVLDTVPADKAYIPEDQSVCQKDW